jgi:hypothetical protein
MIDKAINVIRYHVMEVQNETSCILNLSTKMEADITFTAISSILNLSTKIKVDITFMAIFATTEALTPNR